MIRLIRVVSVTGSSLNFSSSFVTKVSPGKCIRALCFFYVASLAFVVILYILTHTRTFKYICLALLYVSVLFLAFKLVNDICKLVFAFLGLPCLGGKPFGLLFFRNYLRFAISL
jgi:hypothetical protein